MPLGDIHHAEPVTDVAVLRQRVAALRKLRVSGTREVRFGNDHVTFKSDSELAAAIADVERQIGELEGRTLPRVINIRSKSGWT